MAKATLGVLFGNRDFFPDQLITEARSEMAKVLGEREINMIALDESATHLGGVSTFQDAQKCADLFRRHADVLDGLIICLPNFGDEKAAADAIRLSGLPLPLLVQGYPDEMTKMSPDRRRDAFCGKISVCNNLKQYGLAYSLTQQHVVSPSSDGFAKDLDNFVALCRVVNGLKRCRIGAIGARPAAFNTVRYSEKLLEHSGISVVTVDWSELFAAADKVEATDERVKPLIDQMRDYTNLPTVPDAKLVDQARLGVVIDQWMQENAIDTTAMQCWTSVQLNRGVNVCTLMAMMGSKLMPSACEVDVTGALTMYAYALASQTPSALVDWNNNYADDPDRCVLFHCGNWPAECFGEKPTMGTAPILESVIGGGSTYGALDGEGKAGQISFGRISTDDTAGRIRAYFAEGEMEAKPLDTFGSRGVARVAGLEKLLHYICREGFEHHVVINFARCNHILREAFETYMNWDVYCHDANG